MRREWDTYFLEIARLVSTRATCGRAHHGAVIVRERTIVSTGYNGSVRGLPHCEDVGCDVVAGHCERTVHAEVNAIIQAAKNGVRIDGCDIYITAAPCIHCAKAIANAGIRRVFFGGWYRHDERVERLMVESGLEFIDLKGGKPWIPAT